MHLSLAAVQFPVRGTSIPAWVLAQATNWFGHVPLLSKTIASWLLLMVFCSQCSLA